MLNWLRYFQLEKISFFIGFLTATILWLALQNLKKWLPSIQAFIKNTLRLIRQQQLSGISISIRKQALNKAETNHLAYQLFSHQEISIKPKLLAIKQDFRIDKEHIFATEIENIVPFTPDTPYLSRNYQVPALTIAEALQKQASLIITGMPGIGKTFTLADLVISMCLQKSEAGILINKTPLYFDVQDLNESLFIDPQNMPKVHKILVDVFSKKIMVNQRNRLEKFIETELNENNLVLIIDGFDLLSKPEYDRYKIFVEQVIVAYPHIQIVITASTYWADLESSGFIPLAIKPFSNTEIESFYRNWADQWNREILKSDPEKKSDQVILYNWVSKYKQPLTKLEYTLLIWGALEGNLRGTNTLSLYENYFIKLLGNKFNREKIGEKMHEFIEKGSNLVSTNTLIPNPALDSLMNVGVIAEAQSDHHYFKHPDLMGYLASFHASEPATQKTVAELYSWSAYVSYYGFRVSRDAASPWADTWIFEDSPPLFQNLLLIGNWLRHTSPKSGFRSNLIRKLIPLIQNNNLSHSVRLRLLTLFAFANENSGTLFLKQMLNNPDQTMQILAALAAGVFTQDDKIVPDLINALNTHHPLLQKSVCLALLSFDNELATHTLGKMLLSGEESIRKLIAENLAGKPAEGHEILSDAMTMDDILVRRSALFGLIRINEPWALAIIEKTSIEDSQWVVRNVAAQALEAIQKEAYKPIPDKRPVYYDDPWLIEFASTLQQGLSADFPPTDVIHQALKDKDCTTVLNALSFVPRYFQDSFYPEIYHAVHSNHKETSEYATVTLYHLICSGKTLPPAHQFGIL